MPLPKFDLSAEDKGVAHFNPYVRIAIRLEIFDPCHNNNLERSENLEYNLSVSNFLSTANMFDTLTAEVTFIYASTIKNSGSFFTSVNTLICIELKQ